MQFMAAEKYKKKIKNSVLWLKQKKQNKEVLSELKLISEWGNVVMSVQKPISNTV